MWPVHGNQRNLCTDTFKLNRVCVNKLANYIPKEWVANPCISHLSLKNKTKYLFEGKQLVDTFSYQATK